MGFAQWMRVIDAASGLVQMAGRLRRPPAEDTGLTPTGGGGGGPLGQIEARLAGVVVAALKEAFDRDSARLELERSHIEAERQRADDGCRNWVPPSHMKVLSFGWGESGGAAFNRRH